MLTGLEGSHCWRHLGGLHFFGKFCMPQYEAILFFEKAAAKQCALSMYELAEYRVKEGGLRAAARFTFKRHTSDIIAA